MPEKQDKETQKAVETALNDYWKVDFKDDTDHGMI